MTRESARSFGLVSPYWSVVRSNGGYGVDTSKAVFESLRGAAGDVPALCEVAVAAEQSSS